MGKKMVPFSPELFEHLEKRIVELDYEVERRKMFGHEVFFLRGYMFAGANERGIYVHVGTEAKEKALQDESGVGNFEPLEGMAMKEYVLLEREIYASDDRLRDWLRKSNEYLSSLPPKQKK
jgi:TfoX/Sxy family transcriptional regulator of competence genes